MVRAQRRVHPSARWYAARAGSMITKVSEHDSARPALRHGSRELHHTPLPLMRDMNTQTERSPTFSTSINRANAVQGLVALYRLADALRAVGDSDLAAGWEATLREMERCMSRGWKNRNGRATTQIICDRRSRAGPVEVLAAALSNSCESTKTPSSRSSGPRKWSAHSPTRNSK